MTKFCMSVDIHDVITCATFCDDRLRGLGVARGGISHFPIDLRRRPYNTLALPCECVIGFGMSDLRMQACKIVWQVGGLLFTVQDNNVDT